MAEQLQADFDGSRVGCLFYQSY